MISVAAKVKVGFTLPPFLNWFSVPVYAFPLIKLFGNIKSNT